MSKLRAPLFSFRASGQIAKSLVYFGWKGLNLVRSYVVPANPQTALQTTQRAYLTAAVAAIHAAQAKAAQPLAEPDQVAYAALASNHKTPRTWFNEAVKLWVDVKIAVKNPIVWAWGNVADTDRTAVDADIRQEEETGSTLAAATYHMGLTKTNLNHSYAAVVTGGVMTELVNGDISAWAAVGDKVFYQIRPNVADPCEGADSGIYHFRAT